MSGMVVFCGRRELLSLRGRLGSPSVFAGIRVGQLFSFLCFVFFPLFVFDLCFVCPVVQVSLDCPLLIAISVFSSVYFNCAH
jgi:hypothetical protein